MESIDGKANRRGLDPCGDHDLLHVADPPVGNPRFNAPRCRRRNGASRAALAQAIELTFRGAADGVVLAVLKKDGGVEYWVAGRAMLDPVRGSGAAARLLDLMNRLPSYLSDPFPS